MFHTNIFWRTSKKCRNEVGVGVTRSGRSNGASFKTIQNVYFCENGIFCQFLQIPTILVMPLCCKPLLLSQKKKWSLYTDLGFAPRHQPTTSCNLDRGPSPVRPPTATGSVHPDPTCGKNSVFVKTADGFRPGVVPRGHQPPRWHWNPAWVPPTPATLAGKGQTKSVKRFVFAGKAPWHVLARKSSSRRREVGVYFLEKIFWKNLFDNIQWIFCFFP